MVKVLVLGAGLIGGAIARDLTEDPNLAVTVADLSRQNLDRLSSIENLTTLQVDVSDEAKLKACIPAFDFVVNAMPGYLGFESLKAIIESGKNTIDIAFFAEDALSLDPLAKERGIVAITDCGVAPGLGNILVGRSVAQLDEVDSVTIFIGGLPLVREWPFEYKAVFSPYDVIELYTRPARYIENGVVMTKPALSDPELLNFPGVGTVEAFNTDGLRTMMQTIKAKNMREKSLRYPGHIQKMELLRETGFFGEEPIEVKGILIRPIDFTSKLLFPKWELKPGEEDVTAMRVVVEGVKSSMRVRHTYELVDHFDRATKTTSMARTTAYTATAALHMILAKVWDKPGISAPELIGMEEQPFQFMKQGLAKRGVTWELMIEPLT